MNTVLEHMTALADPTRCRMLLLLEKHELTVSELCAVLQMPQSSVSRHLKTLADGNWVTSRRDGTSRFYSMPVDGLDGAASRLWLIIREQASAAAAAGRDERRLRGVLNRRRAKSQEFFASAAGEWDQLRHGLFGDGFALWAVLGLIDAKLVVGDLGCGTGQLTETIAPFVRRVIAVDGSTEMLDAARRRLTPADNVELRQGELEALPLAEGELDVAMLSLVLHYSPEPQRALEEVARVVRPGHVWLGFSEKQVARFLAGAGFDDVRVRALPADPEAKGPALFAAVATRT
jgi:SAM-dependent methyltransferase